MDKKINNLESNLKTKSAPAVTDAEMNDFVQSEQFIQSKVGNTLIKQDINQIVLQIRQN